MNGFIASEENESNRIVHESIAVLLKRRELIRLRLNALDDRLVQIRSASATEEQGIVKEKQPLLEAIDHIEALLRLDGQDLDSSQANSTVPLTPRVLTDAAANLLASRKEPMHYKQIADILSREMILPGRNPAATLLTRMSRDTRFKRGPTRGTYVLSHWRTSSKPHRRTRRRPD